MENSTLVNYDTKKVRWQGNTREKLYRQVKLALSKRASNGTTR